MAIGSRRSNTGYSVHGAGGALTIEGSGLVQDVVVSSTAANGDILCNLQINPAALPDVRLKTIASLYERYTIENLVFTFEGSEASTQTGSILGFYDHDIMETWQSTGGGTPYLQRASAHIGAVQGKLWETTNFMWQRDPKMTDLYADLAAYEPRFTTAGRFLLMLSNLPATLNRTIGKLFVSYRVKFMYPKADPSSHSSLVDGGMYIGDGTRTNLDLLGSGCYKGYSASTWPASQIIHAADGNYINLPSGAYLITVRATLSSTSYTWQNLTGVSYNTLFIKVPPPTDIVAPCVAFSPFNLVNLNEGFSSLIVWSSGTGNVPVTIVGNATGGTVTASYLQIARMPNPVSALGSDLYINLLKMSSMYRNLIQANPSLASEIGLALPSIVESEEKEDTVVVGPSARAAPPPLSSRNGR